MTCSWLVRDLFPTCLWLVHDLVVLKLDHHLFITCSWPVYYMFISCLSPVHHIFIIRSWIVQDSFRTFLIICPCLVHNLFKNFHDLFKEVGSYFKLSWAWHSSAPACYIYVLDWMIFALFKICISCLKLTKNHIMDVWQSEISNVSLKANYDRPTDRKSDL